jgi:tetratricopeptide (TPR) repeat protein
MPRLLLLVLLLLAPATAFAQQAKDWEACNSDNDKEAIPACTRLIRTAKLSKKDFAAAYYNRGLSHRRLGEDDKALADYSKALEYDPNDPEIYNNRGVVYEYKEQLDKAIADYSKAISLDADFVKGYTNRGEAHVKRAAYDKAIADYEKAVGIDPKLADAHADLAGVYAVVGRYDRAVASATRAVTLDGKQSHAYFARGAVHFFRGDYASGSADMRRAADIATSAPAMLYRHMARLRLGENAVPELEADATRLESKVWPYAAIELFLGRRLPEVVLDAAVTEVEKCEAHYMIGQWHLARGDRQQGLASLRSAMSSCPETEYEKLGAQEELRRLGG